METGIYIRRIYTKSFKNSEGICLQENAIQSCIGRVVVSSLSPLVWPYETGGKDVGLWRLNLDLDRPPKSTDITLLSYDERARMQGYHRNADQVRFSATRSALRRLLAQKLACNPVELRFAMHMYGKPYLLGQPSLRFSVSHAGSEVLIGLAESCEIGVDVESCETSFHVANFRSHVLSRHECNVLKDEEIVRDFFGRWTCKEAALKALGLGIAKHLRTLSVFPQSNGEYLMEHPHSDWPSVRAWDLHAPEGYIYAIALAEDLPSTNHFY